MRALTELFAAARAARERDDLERAAVGASGYGFALADQHETARFPAGGSRLAHLPSSSDLGLVARVLGLVQGRVQLRGHLEELFTLTLCAVSPSGGERALSFYQGPSGLALGAGPSNLTAGQGELVAAAWEAALRKAPVVDFQLALASDAGRSWLVVRAGQARHEEAARAGVPPPPVFATDDTTALERALEQDGDRCAAFDALYTAWESTTERARKPFERSYRSRLKLLWLPALEDLERALERGTLSTAMERAAPVLIFPQTFRLDADRQRRLIERWSTIVDRSATPW